MKNISFLVMILMSSLLAPPTILAQHNWELTTIDEGGLCGEFCSAATTSAGDFLVSSFANGNLKLLRSYVDGGNIIWSKEIVDDDGIVGEYSSIAADHNDNPIIAYHDVDNRDLKVARFNGTQWLIDNVDSDESVCGRQISVAIAPSGNPAVAYFHRTSGSEIILRYAWFDSIDWHKENLPADRPSTTSQLSLQFAPDGNPAIAYADSSPKRLFYVKFNGSTWDATNVDDTIDGGRCPSLAFDLAGMPCIAYHVSQNLITETKYDLRYSRFDGDEWISTDVNIGLISDDTGYNASLRFDSSGNPCISYFEWGFSASLQYARFDGAEWILETPQQDGIIGFYSSLVFDNEGNPNIFYFDLENNTLRWAKGTPSQ